MHVTIIEEAVAEKVVEASFQGDLSSPCRTLLRERRGGSGGGREGCQTIISRVISQACTVLFLQMHVTIMEEAVVAEKVVKASFQGGHGAGLRDHPWNDATVAHTMQLGIKIKQ